MAVVVPVLDAAQAVGLDLGAQVFANAHLCHPSLASTADLAQAIG
ncbi:hypothetical protein [Methylothermus subterraneus]